jgi:hypothetical protein
LICICGKLPKLGIKFGEGNEEREEGGGSKLIGANEAESLSKLLHPTSNTKYIKYVLIIFM